MEHSDLLFLLTSRLDNQALEAFSQTEFWDLIKKFSMDQYWWYLRVQSLMHVELEQRPGENWRLMYKILENALQDSIDIFTREVLNNVLATRIAIAAGYNPGPPDQHVLNMSIRVGNPDVLRLLLSDPRVDTTMYDEDFALQLALKIGRTDIVKILVQDGRVDPSMYSNACIRYAVKGRYTDLVKLLLADPRVDPTSRDNEAILTACKNGSTEIVRLLLLDGRADPTSFDNECICVAAGNGHTEVVRLLLEDGRSDPTSAQNYSLQIAQEKGYTEIVDLLMSDRRVLAKLGR